jgi:hypothetical protein
MAGMWCWYLVFYLTQVKNGSQNFYNFNSKDGKGTKILGYTLYCFFSLNSVSTLVSMFSVYKIVNFVMFLKKGGANVGVNHRSMVIHLILLVLYSLSIVGIMPSITTEGKKGN